MRCEGLPCSGAPTEGGHVKPCRTGAVGEESGDRCMPECIPGFRPEQPPQQYRCVADPASNTTGMWSKGKISCVRVRCRRGFPCQDGTPCPSAEWGEKCQVSCPAGYQADDGESHFTCKDGADGLNGTWVAAGSADGHTVYRMKCRRQSGNGGSSWAWLLSPGDWSVDQWLAVGGSIAGLLLCLAACCYYRRRQRRLSTYNLLRTTLLGGGHQKPSVVLDESGVGEDWYKAQEESLSRDHREGFPLVDSAGGGGGVDSSGRSMAPRGSAASDASSRPSGRLANLTGWGGGGVDNLEPEMFGNKHLPELKPVSGALSSSAVHFD